MRSFQQRRWLSLLSVVALGAGCNSVLGIREPISDNLLLDAGSDPDKWDDTTRSDGGATHVEREQIPGVTQDLSWAQWPIPNPRSIGSPSPQSYHLESNDLVTDQVTQLQWQGSIDSRMFALDEAVKYCQSVTIPGGAFRLPTRIELLTLVDYTVPTPSIDSEAFPETPATYFWSGSTFAGDDKSVWIVNFGPGLGYVSASEPTSHYRVRCVRQIQVQ
jgi:hypothetical protein